MEYGRRRSILAAALHERNAFKQVPMETLLAEESLHPAGNNVTLLRLRDNGALRQQNPVVDGRAKASRARPIP